MKKQLLFLSLMYAALCNAQYYFPDQATGFAVIDSSHLESPESYLILNSDSNSLWQMAKPSKIIFNEAFSSNNVLITDSTNNYPINTHSSFELHFSTDEYIDFGLNTTLGFYHQLDTDSLKDGGYVEISYDSGENWYNVLGQNEALSQDSAIYGTTEDDYFMSPNFYAESDTLYNGEYGFSGSTEGWEFFWFNLWWSTPVKFIPDTIKYRFTFISDSIHNPREGWMLDDFYIATYPIGSIGEYLNTISIKIAPNPVKNYTRIQFNNSTNESYELKVFNIDGKLVKSYPSVTESEVLFERAELASGLYFVEILRNHTSLGRSTMILE